MQLGITDVRAVDHRQHHHADQQRHDPPHDAAHQRVAVVVDRHRSPALFKPADRLCVPMRLCYAAVWPAVRLAGRFRICGVAADQLLDGGARHLQIQQHLRDAAEAVDRPLRSDQSEVRRQDGVVDARDLDQMGKIIGL